MNSFGDMECVLCRSARSMAASTTPPIRMRSYLWPIKSGPSAVGIANNSSPDNEARPIPSRNGATKPKPIPRSVSLIQSLFVICLNSLNFVKMPRLFLRRDLEHFWLHPSVCHEKQTLWCKCILD